MKQYEMPEIQRLDKELENILIENDSNRLFVVAGKNSYRSSGAQRKITNILAKYDHHIFSDFTPNPKADDVAKGRQLFEDFKADTIIAIGGGTPMDIAKSIYGFAHTNEDINRYFREGKSGLEIKTQCPLIAVPTTAGTGSESTHFAVIYVDGKKYSFADQRLLPSHYILDTDLIMTDTNPACTALDAFSQALESYWATKADDESRAYAEGALKLLMSNIKDSVKNPNSENKKAVMLAANLAGRAINMSTTTAPHAFSYEITTHFNAPHGQAVMATLPEVLLYNSDFENHKINHPGGKEKLKEIFSGINSILGVSNAKDAKSMILKMASDMGVETDLRKISGLENPDIDSLIAGVNMQRLGNNPLVIETSDAQKIFKDILSR